MRRDLAVQRLRPRRRAPFRHQVDRRVNPVHAPGRAVRMGTYEDGRATATGRPPHRARERMALGSQPTKRDRWTPAVEKASLTPETEAFVLLTGPAPAWRFCP